MCYAGGVNLGLVLFLKAVVVAVAVALWERWQTFKKRKSLSLVQDPVTGVYRPDPRWQRYENIARRAFWTVVVVAVLYGALVWSLIFTAPTGQ